MMNRRIVQALKVLVPALAFPAILQVAATRPWLHGGATFAEMRRALPGDEQLASADVQATRAITVRAAVEAVWPWIVQLGTGRAGWYTSPTEMTPSATDRVNPDLQSLGVGDHIMDPSGRIRLLVVRVDPPWELVLAGRVEPPGAGVIDLTWAFVLVPLGDTRTRVLVRTRFAGSNGLRLHAFAESLELVDAVFTRRMLRGIAARAERAGWQSVDLARVRSAPAGDATVTDVGSTG
jgi:hypothetical protein